MVKKLIGIIEEVDSYITEDSDMMWTHYETANNLKDELAILIVKLTNNDLSCLQELELLFAPTSTLQEVSLMNDWSKEYITIADRFDTICDKIKKK